MAKKPTYELRMWQDAARTCMFADSDMHFTLPKIKKEMLKSAKCGYTVDTVRTWKGGDVYMIPVDGKTDQTKEVKQYILTELN